MQKNWLIKEYAIRDLFDILEIVNVNAINGMILENILTKKGLVDKLVEECAEHIDKAKLAETNLFEHKNVCDTSGKLYIVLFSIIFTINIGISTYFVYYKYMNHNKENVSRYDYVYQATN